jgi:hydrogenase nickel incorporation protein HypA/HybF
VHELAITQNLLKVVLDEAKAARANKVTRINLVVGELSGAVSDCVQFYFDILKKDTAAVQEAAIDFKQVPAQLKCRDCQTEFHPQDAPWVCPGCGSHSIEIIGGRDCYIESIEVEP